MNATRSTKIASELDLSGVGAAYLRISDDEQEIETQRVSVDDWAKRHGVTITKYFIDEGWSRDEHDIRPDWLEMLAAIDRREFNWLIIEAKDRFGTASGRKKIVYFDRLWEAGCKLFTTGDELLNAPSLSGNINALMDGETEEKELRSKSERAINKMRQHAQAGRWTGGPIPYGMDVVCVSAEGKERWRVISEGRNLRIKMTPDGVATRYDGAGNFPSHDAKDWLTLRPSENPKRLKIIKDIFNWFDREAITVFGIASRLNQQGKKYSLAGLGRWDSFTIEYILRNPVYLGFPTFNKSSQGKWNAWRDGRRIEHDTPQRIHTALPRTDWVKPEKQFEGIISDEQWERVNAKLDARKSVPHAPKAADLWLSGLIICEGCGLPMFGAKRKNRGVYWCKSNVKKLPGCRCALNTLEHAEIEGHLKTYLHDAGHVVAEFGKKKTSKDEGEKFRADVEKAMWEYFYMAKATEKTEQEAGTLRIITPPWETGSDDVSKSYRKLFDSRQPKLRSELDQLETSHTRLTLAWSDLPTARAKEKARIRLAELEAEMTEIEKQLINHADGWDDALRRVRTLQNDWEKMSTSIASETSGRLKATAVRRIISQIRCKFVPTGLHRPTARLISITFIPKIGTNAVVNTEELPRRRRWLSFS